MFYAGLGASKTPWGSESNRSLPRQVSWSECTHDLVLQMSKSSVWYYYLVTAGIKLVYQVTHVGCFKPFPILLHTQIFREISLQFLWCQVKEACPSEQSIMLAREAYCLTWALFSHWKKWRSRWNLSPWCYVGLGMEKCGQYVPNAVFHVLYGAGGASASPLRISQWWANSWRTYITILVTLVLFLFLNNS